jgi:hypothetical protein
MKVKEHSDLRQGNSCLFPRVQTLNRVTLFKILLINLETAFKGYNGSWNSTQEDLSLTFLPTAICDR